MRVLIGAVIYGVVVLVAIRAIQPRSVPARVLGAVLVVLGGIAVSAVTIR